MNLLQLFEAEKTRELSKISRAAAIMRCEQVVDNHERLSDDQKAQIGRMPFGTKQTASYVHRAGTTVYFLRSKFGR